MGRGGAKPTGIVTSLEHVPIYLHIINWGTLSFFHKHKGVTLVITQTGENYNKKHEWSYLSRQYDPKTQCSKSSCLIRFYMHCCITCSEGNLSEFCYRTFLQSPTELQIKGRSEDKLKMNFLISQ